MFEPIQVPYGAKMLANTLELKDGVSIEDIELLLGEMCNVVKNKYADNGFIAGQVFKLSGFVSDEGSINPDKEDNDDKLLIITYWDSYEQHEDSHADSLFSEKFKEVASYCSKSTELGYDMLWQGEPE